MSKRQMTGPRAPKLDAKVYRRIADAVRKAQVADYLFYNGRKMAVPHLPDGKVNGALIFKGLIDDERTAKVAAGLAKTNKACTMADVVAKVKLLAEQWETARVGLPVPADAPDGTTSVVVKVVKQGDNLGCIGSDGKFAALPEGCSPVKYFTVNGLDMSDDSDDDFDTETITGLENIPTEEREW